MNSLSVLIVALAIWISSAFSAESPRRALFKDAERQEIGRIVGGAPAQRRQFPYQVSYQLNNQHICGGSILTRDWVLTAGHCIVGQPSNTRVIAGMLNQGENHPDVQIAGIQRQIIHPLYPGGVNPYDIALLQLSRSLSWTAAVQPITLPQANQEFSGFAWVTGWGYLNSDNPVTPTTLQQIQMYILTFAQCSYNLVVILGDSYPLDNSMVCVAGADTGKETVCQGDSGGPLQQNGILIGVTSWTVDPCGTYAAPSVYTKVSKFLPFIKQYVPGV